MPLTSCLGVRAKSSVSFPEMPRSLEAVVHHGTQYTSANHQKQDSSSKSFAWLWEKDVLQGLVDELEYRRKAVYKEADGRQYVQVNWNGHELKLLTREAYDELWEILEELNYRANRRSKDSPINRRKELPKSIDRVTGWYMNRNYMIVGNSGVGKTAFLLLTMISRVMQNLPVIIQSSCGFPLPKVFLIHNFKVLQLDSMALETDIVDQYYKMNRQVWMLFDSSPLPNLLNPNWVKIQTTNGALGSNSPTRFIRQHRPVRLFIDVWTLGEVAFVGSHILGYTPRQLRKALILYQCFDPTARMAFCSQLVKKSHACEAYLSKLREWIPQEIEKLLTTGSSLITVVKDSQISNVPCQIITQRPDLHSLGYKYIGISTCYQVTTRYICETIVSVGFYTGCTSRIETWVRDLNTQEVCSTAETLLRALIQRKMRSGGQFSLTPSRSCLATSETILLAPTDQYISPRISRLHQMLVENETKKCPAEILDQYLAPQHETRRSVNFAIVNEYDGPRLMVFWIDLGDQVSEIYAEDLTELWNQMPEEVKIKSPCMVTIRLDAPDIVQPTNASSERRMSITSSENDWTAVNKVASMFLDFDLILNQRELFEDSFTFSMKMNLWYKQLMRLIVS